MLCGALETQHDHDPRHFVSVNASSFMAHSPAFLVHQIQMLFGYEVSFYEELSGSDSWNGSVLAGMYIVGKIAVIVHRLFSRLISVCRLGFGD